MQGFIQGIVGGENAPPEPSSAPPLPPLKNYLNKEVLINLFNIKQRNSKSTKYTDYYQIHLNNITSWFTVPNVNDIF